MACGAGTHFNPALGNCDWPENALCAPEYRATCEDYVPIGRPTLAY